MEQAEKRAKPFRTIVAAIDGEEYASRVIEQATRLAIDASSALHIVHVVMPLVPPGEVGEAFARDLRDDQMRVAREFTDRMGAFATSIFDGEITVHLIRGDLTDGILRVAERVEADVVVVGTHDYRGVKRLLMGSVARDVAGRAPCPVLVARPTSYSASRVPAIEPLCEECARARAESGGARAWCAQHGRKHPRAHVHYEYPQGFGSGSQILRI